MRIFLTGATGYIGTAVLEAMLRGGHDVTGLVRDPEKAEQMARRGIRAIVGELSKPASYDAAAEECDALVHTASEHSKRRQKVDRQAIDALTSTAERRAAAGKAAIIVYTSGVWVLGPTQGQATEDAALRPPAHVAWRPEHEQLVLDAARDRRIRTIVVRPGIVYGGARGIVGDLLKDALNGLVRVVGEGQNHWPCVYDRDLADLYARVVANPEAAGVFHASDEADERVADIVESIASHCKVRPDVRHVPIAEARAKMGTYADALALDQIVRSPRARAIGWAPTLRSVSGNISRLMEEFRARREAA
jgi:nucleoside-diphosphate-sugar epimerase